MAEDVIDTKFISKKLKQIDQYEMALKQACFICNLLTP